MNGRCLGANAYPPSMYGKLRQCITADEWLREFFGIDHEEAIYWRDHTTEDWSLADPCSLGGTGRGVVYFCDQGGDPTNGSEFAYDGGPKMRGWITAFFSRRGAGGITACVFSTERGVEA